jgi:hypothetical protein
MSVTFTLEQLLALFEEYNQEFWPMQILAYLLGIIALVLVFKPGDRSNRIISGILAFLWLWTGIVFYFFYFGKLYPPAYVVGVLIIVQGLFFLSSAFKPRISFAYPGGGYGIIGLIFVGYAMVGYPLFGALIGHIYPQSPPFGLAPCPLTIFTFGLFLLTVKKIPRLFLIIPFIWSIGGISPVSVGILEDIGLIISGVLGTVLLLLRDRSLPE